MLYNDIIDDFPSKIFQEAKVLNMVMLDSDDVNNAATYLKLKCFFMCLIDADADL